MTNAPSSALDAARSHVVSGRLDNGLTWSCWPEPRDRVATVQVWLRVGSADEPPGRTGAAHMLEHLMFRGTEAVPDGQFDAAMERLGALVNAATWIDSTFYTTTCAPEALTEVLRLEADRLANLAITEPVFATERQVVASERRQVVDGVPDARFRERFQALAHRGTPYAWPVIGWAEDIQAFTRDAITAFYRAFYTPTNAHVVVCGRVDAGVVARAIAAAFSDWEGPATTARATHQLAGEERDLEDRLPLAAPRVCVAFDGPSRTDPMFAAWRVVEDLLAGGEAGRLPVRLEFDEQIALDVDLELSETRAPSAMSLEVTLRDGAEPLEALELLEDELALLASDGPTDDELTRAVRTQLSDDARALASTESRAEWIGESWILYDDPVELFRAGEALAAVDRRSVMEVAETLCDRSRRTTGVARCE